MISVPFLALRSSFWICACSQREPFVSQNCRIPPQKRPQRQHARTTSECDCGQWIRLSSISQKSICGARGRAKIDSVWNYLRTQKASCPCGLGITCIPAYNDYRSEIHRHGNVECAF